MLPFIRVWLPTMTIIADENTGAHASVLSIFGTFVGGLWAFLEALGLRG